MTSLSSQGMSWEDVSAHMKKHREATLAAVDTPEVPKDLPLNVTNIPKDLLPEDVLAITESSVEDLLPKLSSGKLTSTAVTKAFLQRAGLASKLTNCITELLPEQALARAKYCDDYLAQHKSPIGPLHGLPISVKEHVTMKDLDINAGFVGWVGKKGSDDALILKYLWKAGCVFYARTTEPQTLMHLESDNNIYGVTTNPYNTNLTCGGSSGGEGALVGMRGSCLGIGTDIGGSIRSPAANNGVFGLRPTTYRLPTTGWALTMAGNEAIIAVIGPLSTSLEGLKIFTKAIVDQQPWLNDPTLVALPWKDPIGTGTLLRTHPSTGKRRLRIGVLADDGVVKPHPPIQRGIKTLVSRLAAHPDFEIVEFPPYKHDEAWRIISSLYFGDGAADEKRQLALSGEPYRPLTEFIISDNPNVKELTVPELWSLMAQKEEYQRAYQRHWNAVGTTSASLDGLVDEREAMVDVILTPTGPGVAPPHNCSRYWGYTSQWNLLDYPCVVFPTGLYVGKEEDPVEVGYEPRNEQDRYNYEMYKPETFIDAPISLQLVGRRFDDEKVLEALEMMLQAAGPLA